MCSSSVRAVSGEGRKMCRDRALSTPADLVVQDFHVFTDDGFHKNAYHSARTELPKREIHLRHPVPLRWDVADWCPPNDSGRVCGNVHLLAGCPIPFSCLGVVVGCTWWSNLTVDCGTKGMVRSNS